MIAPDNVLFQSSQRHVRSEDNIAPDFVLARFSGSCGRNVTLLDQFPNSLENCLSADRECTSGFGDDAFWVRVQFIDDEAGDRGGIMRHLAQLQSAVNSTRNES